MGDLEAKLEQMGIDPSDFKNNITSMMKDGKMDVPSLFSNAKIGSDVDLFA